MSHDDRVRALQDIQPSSDTHVQCLECSRWYQKLSGHLRVHGLSTAEYRELHGLPTSTPLSSPLASARQADSARAQYANNEGLRSAVRDERWRARTLAGMQRAQAANADRPGFLAVWQDALTRAAHTRQRTHRARYDAKANTLGYRNIDELVAGTWTMTDLHLGQLLGISESNAEHLRKRWGARRPPQELAGTARRALQYMRATNRRYEERARQAGYASIAEMLDQTRNQTHRELARQLGMSPQAALRLRVDPTMARLRPGAGEPIVPDAELRPPDLR